MSPSPDTALMAALDVKRELAAHTAECVQRQKRLEEILGEIKGDVKELKTGTEPRLRALEDEQRDRAAERKTLVKIGSVAGVVGGAIAGVAVKALPFLGSLIR